MRVFFRQLKIFQVLSTLTAILVIIMIVLGMAVTIKWYESLPEDSQMRSSFKLGRFLTKFEIGHLFYDWRTLDIPIYDLAISRKNMKKILSNLPPEGSLMIEEYKEYANAKFSYKNQTYDVKTRIHGLAPNHWRDEKKSWRIKFKSEELFERKKNINLIIPQDRGFFAEYLSNHIARKMGLLAPFDNFVFLRINGILQGIYYEIEKPTQKFLELHGKVDSANLYREENWDWNKYGYDPIFTDVGHWQKNANETVSQFDNYAEMDYLLTLLNKADNDRFYKEIPALVDINNFLTWQAHSMIMGSHHQSEHGNINLYFNIIDGKFEFLPMDVGMFPITDQFFDKPYNPFVTRMLKKPEYLHKRNLILWEYLNNPNNLKDDLQYYDNAYKKHKRAFYADREKGFTNAKFDKETRRLRNMFLANRDKIIANLSYAGLFANIHLFPENSDVLAVIDMVSHGFSAADFKDLKVYFYENKNITDYPDLYLYYDSNNSGVFEKTDALISKLILQAGNKFLKSDKFSFLLYSDRDENLQPAKRYYKFFIVSAERGSIEQEPLSLEIIVDNAVTKEAINPRYHYIDDRLFKDFGQVVSSLEDFILLHPIFKKDTTLSNACVLPIAEYNIDRNIIVPSGVNISIEPGTILRFSKGISFISYGKITVKGTKTNPIILTALDKTEPWGNFAVVGSEADNSELEYVVIEYGGESFINGIYFTGAVAIHNATAKISNCIFRYNTGDDSINTKIGESTIQRSVFYKNSSDGIDYDFSRGIAKDNYIKDNVGDGIDLCRSDIFVEGNRIEGSGDKGISVGEESNPIIVNNLIRKCNVGIASKDRSNPIILNNTLVENEFGIEAYGKKLVFGAAKGSVDNTIFWDNKKDLNVEAGSKLDIRNCVVRDYHEGENILTIEPKFINKESGDYELSSGDIDNKLLISRGNIEPLKKISVYENIKDAPIGILSNPKVLSTSNFIEE